MINSEKYSTADLKIIDFEVEGAFLGSSPVAKHAWSVHTTQWQSGSITDGLSDEDD